jgi:hypothetical protein
LVWRERRAEEDCKKGGIGRPAGELAIDQGRSGGVQPYRAERCERGEIWDWGRMGAHGGSWWVILHWL